MLGVKLFFFFDVGNYCHNFWEIWRVVRANLPFFERGGIV